VTKKWEGNNSKWIAYANPKDNVAPLLAINKTRAYNIRCSVLASNKDNNRAAISERTKLRICPPFKSSYF